MIMRFNGFEIVIKKRIWFHFDDEVMDMWWKSRREGRDETRDKKTGSESVKGTLYPFSLFALFRIKVDLKSPGRLVPFDASESKKSWERVMLSHPLFPSEFKALEMCKKRDFTSLIRWISRELLWKRIFNCPGNSEWSCIRQHPWKGNFYTWFLVKSIIKQKRGPLFSPNEETFMKRGESSMALYECEMEVGSIQANTQFFRWSNKKFC